MANCSCFTITNYRRYNGYDIWLILFKADLWAWVLIFEKFLKFNFFFLEKLKPRKRDFYLREPDFIRPLITGFMVISVFKFSLVLLICFLGFNIEENFKHVITNKVFVKFSDIVLVFVFEDAVMVFIQYFYYDKYTYYSKFGQGKSFWILI